jgi:hypothetical protein
MRNVIYTNAKDAIIFGFVRIKKENQSAVQIPVVVHLIGI